MEVTFNKNKDVDDFIKSEFYKLRPSLCSDGEYEHRTILIGEEEKNIFKNNFRKKFGLNSLPDLKVINSELEKSGTSLRIVVTTECILGAYFKVWEVVVETREMGIVKVRL